MNKKFMSILISIIVITGSLVLSSTAVKAAEKNGWTKATPTTWCFYSKGKLVKNAWEQNSLKQWFYFDGDGKLVKNKWLTISGNQYYLTVTGARATNQWVTTGASVFYVGGNGAMVKNTTILGYKINAMGVRSLIIIAPITSIIFQGGKDFGSKYFRIPHLITTKHGTIVAGSDIRYNGGNDFGQIDQGIARSIDGGKTWINKQVILTNNHVFANSRVMDATMIYNANTDKIFVFAVKLDDNINWFDKTTKTNWNMVYTTSSNDGITWSKEISIKHVIDSFPDRTIFLGGVGSGIVMNNGTMVLPIQASNINPLYKIRSGLIYSKDNGVTWTMSQNLVPEFSIESNLVEYADGQLLINARSDGSGKRVLYKTSDMGTTWIPTVSNNLDSPNKIIQLTGCMGSMIRVLNKILYCQPVNLIGNRGNPTLMSTTDNGETWKIIASVYPAYTDGYTGLSFFNNKLYIVLEISGSIIFKEITKLIN